MLQALAIEKPRTVMVVDDDCFSQLTLCESLSQLGPISIYKAQDGMAALRMIKSGAVSPDVLICDIYMPNMDGLQFLGELAEMRFQGDVVVVSGVSPDMLEMASEMASNKGLHVTGAFLKPVAKSQLSEALSLGCKV